MPKMEYHSENIPAARVNDRLNALAADGWQFCQLGPERQIDILREPSDVEKYVERTVTEYRATFFRLVGTDPQEAEVLAEAAQSQAMAALRAFGLGDKEIEGLKKAIKGAAGGGYKPHE